MEGADNVTLLSSLVEAYTNENASLNSTEPTTHRLSINEMSQVTLKTYNLCQICGVQGHYAKLVLFSWLKILLIIVLI